MRRKLLGSAMVVAAALTLGACSEGEDVAFFNLKMYNTSSSSFETQLRAEWAKISGLSASAVKSRWDSGDTGFTDSSTMKGQWYDLSTNFCSSSPDTGPSFNFRASCARHDFGWRNLKRLDRNWNCPGSGPDAPCGYAPRPYGTNGRYNTRANRRTVNEQFLRDMSSHCSGRSIVLRPSCQATANLYFTVVEIAT